jgi:2-methylisocitrate lyase-like PEP mutase family enzyme
MYLSVITSCTSSRNFEKQPSDSFVTALRERAGDGSAACIAVKYGAQLIRITGHILTLVFSSLRDAQRTTSPPCPDRADRVREPTSYPLSTIPVTHGN